MFPRALISASCICDHSTQRISMNSELGSAKKLLFLSIDFKVHPRKSKKI